VKNEVMETRTAQLYLGKDGISRIIVKQGAEITIDEIKENFAALSQITASKKAPSLIDLRGIKSINREARVYLSDEETVSNNSASALLIGSPVSKMIGNFFIGLNKPPYPTKLFTSESKALEWLKGFVDKEES
jgi:hypothetical protein